MDSNPILPTRRELLRGVMLGGGGLLLGVQFVDSVIASASDIPAGVFAPDAFIRIAPDNVVTLIMSQVEMGQGIYTGIAMIIAEELDLVLDAVRLEAAPADDKLYGSPLFGIQMTGGSTSTRAYWMPMRKAGAMARAMLVEAAARRWRVPADTCRTEAGQVLHPESGRAASYGSLAAAAALVKPPAEPVLKDPSTFRLIGKAHKRLDTAGKVDGSLKYGIDAMPEGTKFATLAASPVNGGKVRRVDDRQAKMVPGVRQIVVLDDLVAVVGDHMWAAIQGLEALQVEWAEGPNATLSSADIWRSLEDASKGDAVIAKQVGDTADTLKGDGTVEGTYELPFLTHLAMEPMNCTVHVRQDLCEIWVGTQVMTKAQRIAAEASGLRPDQIVIHNHMIGGGFGRRLEVDGIGKAVRIARQVKGPVKIVWTREEDVQKSMYRPIYRIGMKARLVDGKPVAWNHRTTGAAILARFLPPAFTKGIDVDAVDGAADPPYDLPNMRSEFVRFEPQGVDTCFWRGVGPNVNIFAIESFMDKLAKKAGTDPVSFRRSLLKKNPRALAVLDLAVAKSGWGAPSAPRSGRGVCLTAAFGSYLACVADVVVGDDGDVTVKRLVCAVDCGTIVNPDSVVAQVQGGMIFGLGAVLHDQITLANGRVQQSNFHDFRVVRIDETPLVEVHLIKSGEMPGGMGEPGTTVVQPAIVNAVFAATGTQLTRMPINRALIAKGAA